MQVFDSDNYEKNLSYFLFVVVLVLVRLLVRTSAFCVTSELLVALALLSAFFFDDRSLILDVSAFPRALLRRVPVGSSFTDTDN